MALRTRNITVSYGVERSTDYYFILSQYMRLTDRQTDGPTSIARARLYMQMRAKNVLMPLQQLHTVFFQELTEMKINSAALYKA